MNAGLYVHVPFCIRKCAYCSFTSYPGRERDIPRYLTALKREMDLRKPLPILNTIFFGGGTPSLPPPDFIPTILSALRERTVIELNAEITCEANPGTLTRRHVEEWRKAGVTRLSLGVQASQDKLLAVLERSHRLKDIHTAVELWGDADSLSLDLMFGLPGQTLQHWRNTLEAALSLRPGHLSCYSLMLEEGTLLHRRAHCGDLLLPDDDTERIMADLAEEELAKAGYMRYEISNWARDGYICRHNLNTWQRRGYIGIGCAAASFTDGIRMRNLCDLDEYMTAVEGETNPTEEYTQLTDADALFEELMLGLRLIGGVELSAAAFSRYKRKLQDMDACGLVFLQGCRVRLTRRGIEVMNAVLVELLPETP